MLLKGKRFRLDFILLRIFTLSAALLLFTNSARVTDRNKEKIFVPLSVLINKFDFKVDNDPALTFVKLGFRNKKVIIIPAYGAILVGSKIFYVSCKEKEGGLLIDEMGVDLIIRSLTGRRLKWKYSNGSLLVGSEIKSVKEKRRPETNITVTGTAKNTGRRVYRASVRAVIIDPGHGGKDPGGIGYNGIKEKDIVLSVAKLVADRLKKDHHDLKVIITRNDDRFIPLEGRAKIANSVEPSLNPVYVSIHANVSYNKKTLGYETYYLTIDPKGEEARKVADMENSVINYESIENKKYLDDIINRIVDIEYRRESIKLANNIQNSISDEVGSVSINRGVKGAYFYVLKAVKMPSVLIEIGFITNRMEALNLTSKKYQKKLAKGIVDGIEEFIDEFEKTNGFTEKPAIKYKR